MRSSSCIAKCWASIWGKLPRNAISAIGPLLSSFVHLLLALYLPSLKFRKIPTERDTEVIDLFHKKCKALAVTDPIKFFFEFLYLFKGATNFKLTEFDLGNEIFMDASALFSFSGLSFRLSRKILDSAKEISRKANVKILMNRDFLETIHNYFSGHWKEIKAFDDDLADENLSLGEIWGASQNLYWHGLPSIYQGSIDKANYSINRLNDIIEEYENDFSLILKFELDTNLLLERRDLQNALLAIEKAIELANKAGFAIYLFDMYCYKVWIHILMGDIEKAKKNLMHANEIRAEVNAVPIELSNFCRSQLEYHLYRLKESIKSGNSSALSKYRKDAYKSSKMLIKVSKKAAQHRTEAYKLMGVYYWLINKQKKALKSWQKAIEEGEGLGAQLELSRTYFEIGKRLLEGGSKYKILNGLKAETYLEKANALFREMDLQWDLDELDRLVRS